MSTERLQAQNVRVGDMIITAGWFGRDVDAAEVLLIESRPLGTLGAALVNLYTTHGQLDFYGHETVTVETREEQDHDR